VDRGEPGNRFDGDPAHRDVIGPLIVLISLSAAGAALAWRASGPWSPAPAGVDPTTPSRATALTYLLLYIAGSIVLLINGESQGAGPLLAGEAVALFGVGAILGRRLLGATPYLPASNANGVRNGPMLALGAIGVVALATLIVQFGIPLIARDPLASRAGFSGLVFDIFRWLVPPAALVALGLAVTRGGRRDVAIAAIALVGVGGIEVLLASRALPFELAVEAILVAWWAERRPSRGQWLGLAAAGLIAFVGIQLVRGSPAGGFGGIADAAGFATRRTVDRVLLIHPRTLEVIATTIPDEEPYFLGSTYIRRISEVLGQPPRPSLGAWLFERLFPGEPVAFAAPGVAGEAWANGGPALVALIMGALGAAAVGLARLVGRLPGGPADRAFAAILIVALARTYATSLNGFLLTVAVTTVWWLVVSRGRPRRAADRLDGPRSPIRAMVGARFGGDDDEDEAG
jgi:hypothetical protein